MPPSFFFNDPATTEMYTLSLHDALPISCAVNGRPVNTISWNLRRPIISIHVQSRGAQRSEEHTSELQSRRDLVCRLLLEKKKKKQNKKITLLNPTYSSISSNRILAPMFH